MTLVLEPPQSETEEVFEYAIDPITKQKIKITYKNSNGRKCKCCGCDCPCKCDCCKQICCTYLPECPDDSQVVDQEIKAKEESKK